MQVLHWRFPMGSVFQAYADAIFRTAGDELTRRALGETLGHPTLAHPILAPQVLADWTPPMESPAARFRAAAHIQRRARGMATRSRPGGTRGPASAAISQPCKRRAASRPGSHAAV